ncbi:RNA polymerase sigma factor [Terriglobus sp. 2YAB30_2]|uniref:RNA polymerase sigma factor n=1 Tax=unclassified Terriglobus TaxID=2628988 RepID=UPI003F9E846D
MTHEMSLDEQNRFLTETMERDKPRLRSFIRRRVKDADQAEDILQEVFYELVETYRMMKPVETATGWMFTVARNRITDMFRKKTPESLQQPVMDDSALTLEDLLPSRDAGPEAAYAREVLMDLIEEALDELPEAQREVFIAHEVDGLSFKEISAATGVGVSTLLSRKRYAVLHLRERLEEMKDVFESR